MKSNLELQPVPAFHTEDVFKRTFNITY